jgi:hypothetical protein
MATQFDFASLGNMFGGGGVPTGLDALLTEDQRKLLGRNAALSAAAALLQASGRSAVPISMGQALGSALQAGQQGYEKARAGSFQDLILGGKLKEMQTAQDLQKQVAGVLTKAPTVLSPEQQALRAPVSEAGPFGPKVARAELAASIQPPSANELKAGQYQQIADIYASQGRSEDAKRFQEMSERLNPRPEIVGQPIEVTDTKGNPILVQQYKDGSVKTMTGYGPKRDVVLQSLGGQTVAINKSALKGGETFAQTMTPAEIANLGISRANLGVAQAGLGLRQREFDRSGFDRVDTAEGFFNVPKGGGVAVPVMGPSGEQLKGVSGGKATEGERKAATLLSRMQLAQTQIMGEGEKGTPGLFTSMSPRVGLAEERKRVEDAQLDFLDAALTLATGAAYTEFQLKSAMQAYFPKFGDDATTITEKELRRQNLMEAARISAGTMSSAVPPPPPKPVTPAAEPGAAPGAVRRKPRAADFFPGFGG